VPPSTIADALAVLGIPNPLSLIDSLSAATAKVHGLTLGTRNVDDFVRTGVSVAFQALSVDSTAVLSCSFTLSTADFAAARLRFACGNLVASLLLRRGPSVFGTLCTNREVSKLLREGGLRPHLAGIKCSNRAFVFQSCLVKAPFRHEGVRFGKVRIGAIRLDSKRARS